MSEPEELQVLESEPFERAIAERVAEFLRELGVEATTRKVRRTDRFVVVAHRMLVEPVVSTGPYTARNLPETRGRRRDPITEMASRIPEGQRGPDLTVTPDEYARIQALISRWRNRPSGKPVFVRRLRELPDGRVVAGFFHVAPEADADDA